MSGQRSIVTRVGVAAVLVFACAGCNLLAAPTGPAPLRFRDPVFSGVTVTSGLPFGTVIDRHTGDPVTLDFDLYEPTGDTSTNRPLVIWIHGGSFTSLTRTSPEIVDEANHFAMEGYVNASIDYRLSPTGCDTFDTECAKAIDDAIADAQLAVRYFRVNAAQFGIDPNLISVAGSSAGAITALDVGYQVVMPPEGYPDVSASVKSAVSLSGAALFDFQIGAGDAPALDFHDTTDPLVPYSLAQATQNAAKQADVPYYEVTWDETGHVPYEEHRDEILTDTTNFLYNTLGLNHWVSNAPPTTTTTTSASTTTLPPDSTTTTEATTTIPDDTTTTAPDDTTTISTP